MGLFSKLFRHNDIVIDDIRFQITSSYDDTADTTQLNLLSLPSVANALEIKANDVAQLPLYVYSKTDTGREKIVSDLAYRLAVKPNNYQNAYEFWHLVAVQTILGECHILMQNGQFTLLPFGLTTQVTLEDGIVVYAVQYSESERKSMNLAPGTIKTAYEYNQVLHFAQSTDEHGNVVPLNVRFAKTFGLGTALTSYTSNVYNRGGTLSGYLTTDKPVNEDIKKQVIRGFKKLFHSANSTESTGSDLKLAALDNSWKFNTINLTPQELQLLESKKDFIRDIAKIFNLPIWKLGILEDYHYSTGESAQRDYLQSSLNPMLTAIEKELNAKLFDQIEFGSIYVEFYREKLISIDSKTKSEILSMHCRNGITSINEAREILNLSHVPGGTIRAVPVYVTSAEYTGSAEKLKLEKLQLENELLRKQLLAPTNTATPAATEIHQNESKPVGQGSEPIQTTETPESQPEEEQAEGLAKQLESLQLEAIATNREALEAAIGETDPEIRQAALEQIYGQVMASVWQLHSAELPNATAFVTAFTASADQRLGKTSIDYEINRAINAANFEALKHAYGTTCQLRWVGGEFNGQTRLISETWTGTLRHPPTNNVETCSFLEKA